MFAKQLKNAVQELLNTYTCNDISKHMIFKENTHLTYSYGIPDRLGLKELTRCFPGRVVLRPEVRVFYEDEDAMG
ncbi:hypothetical protein HDU67_003408 [Dinochytrium kinnereticum]|nr:hypothetical protein HDU67_003408 [Dinochytrium kinnereticum]